MYNGISAILKDKIMNYKKLLTLLLMFLSLTTKADVLINKEVFPDEIFRNYLLAQPYGRRRCDN